MARGTSPGAFSVGEKGGAGEGDATDSGFPKVLVTRERIGYS